MPSSLDGKLPLEWGWFRMIGKGDPNSKIYLFALVDFVLCRVPAHNHGNLHQDRRIPSRGYFIDDGEDADPVRKPIHRGATCDDKVLELRHILSLLSSCMTW